MWAKHAVLLHVPRQVVVYTGLIRLLGGRRDLLATVLGHEVAHALARHGTEKVREAAGSCRKLLPSGMSHQWFCRRYLWAGLRYGVAAARRLMQWSS